MNTKTLRSRYRQLSPSERLALVLEALCRKDDAETEALIDSCPIHQYAMQEPKFWELHDCSRMIAYLFAGEWFRIKNEIETARLKQSAFHLAGSWFESGFGLALEACESVPSEKSPVWRKYEDRLKPYTNHKDKAKGKERLASARLKGLHTGFLRFCNMAQLEPHQLLAWTPPLSDEMKEFLEGLAPDVEADPETAKTIFESLALVWPVAQDDKNFS